jgi:hypothetical protein
MVCFKIRSEALTVAKVNKFFSGYQTYWLVKNYGHLRHHLCPHQQGIHLEYHSGICLEKLKRIMKRLRIADLGPRFELRTTSFWDSKLRKKPTHAGSSWFVEWLTLWLWRWRRYFPPKRWALSELHRYTAQLSCT